MRFSLRHSVLHSSPLIGACIVIVCVCANCADSPSGSGPSNVVHHEALGLCLASSLFWDATRPFVVEHTRDGASAQLYYYHVMYVRLADIQARLAD